MSRFWRIVLLSLAGLAGILLAWGALRLAPAARAAPASLPAGLQTPVPLPNQPSVENPTISFIDSPSAACVLPQRHTGSCYLTWSYMYASADPNYMITMTVAIDGKLRGRYHGFFQTSMYIPPEMLVFRVTCGALGSGGVPGFGAAHSYTLRGRDSNNLTAANYGSVLCPADQPLRLFLPLQKR